MSNVFLIIIIIIIIIIILTLITSKKASTSIHEIFSPWDGYCVRCPYGEPRKASGLVKRTGEYRLQMKRPKVYPLIPCGSGGGGGGGGGREYSGTQVRSDGVRRPLLGLKLVNGEFLDYKLSAGQHRFTQKMSSRQFIVPKKSSFTNLQFHSHTQKNVFSGGRKRLF